MKNASVWVALGIVLAATVGVGVVHGRLTNRWGAPPAMIAAGARLSRIPDPVGDWRRTASRSISATAREMLECTGDVVLTYVRDTDGAAVNVALIVGPSGPISVHTPEVCFSSRNHKLVEQRRSIAIRDAAGGSHELWRLTFRAQDLEAQLLRVYYGWSTGGAWAATGNPRFEHAGSPYLYKLQAACYLSPTADLQEDDHLHAFLQEFLPVVQPVLVARSSEL